MQYGMVWLGLSHGVNMCCAVLKPMKSAFSLVCCVDVSTALWYDLLNQCLMAVSCDVSVCSLALFTFHIFGNHFHIILHVACPSSSNA